jgi:hypothetical protein
MVSPFYPGRSQEHALYDTAGIIGFFATITIVVDFSGHFSEAIGKSHGKIHKHPGDAIGFHPLNQGQCMGIYN